MFVPIEELDADLCLASGQVFRFVRTERGWVGPDGRNRITANRVTGGWEVCSEPDESAAFRFFRLDVSAKEMGERVLQLAKELAPYIRRHAGLRVLRPERADETLFSFLCTANNHLSRISKMVHRLGEYGEPMGGNLFSFPSAHRIAAIKDQELRAKGFGYRGRVIPAVAQQVVERGANWLDSLRSSSYQAAHASLSELAGVGPKLADCVCLVGLGHDQAVPIDTHLWQASTELYFPEWKGKSLTASRYRAVGDHFREKFGSLAGWAHQYLFYDRILDYRKGKRPA